MPTKAIPTYRKHPNGQAFVKSIAVNDGKPYYLGRHGSPESRQRYAALLDQLEAGSHVARGHNSSRSIAEVVARFLPAAKEHYTRGDELSSEYDQVLHALKPLIKLFGTEPAKEFGPRKLKDIQRAMVLAGLSRKVVNRRINRIRIMWRWASSEELVPPELYHGLLSVRPLTRGQYGVRELPDVGPVDRATVELTLLYTPPAISSMIRLQLACGMRPAEVCSMRWCDINQANDTWLYSPPKHKNAWRDTVRRILITRDVQPILNQYLFMPSTQPIFRRRAYRDRPAAAYTPMTYWKAIQYAFKRAERKGVAIQRWHPHQLRHTRATEISQLLGEQAAQVFLGHESLSTTGIYVERQLQELLAVADRLAGTGGPPSTAAELP
jgi:integrase